MKFILLFTTLIGSLSAQAFFETKNLRNLKLHMGNWFEYPGQMRASKTGETNGLAFSPFFATSLDYQLHEKFLLTPEVGYILQRSSENIDKNQFFIRVEGSYLVTENFKLSMGSSFMMLNISSDGGEEVLPNGTSEDTFFRPAESSTVFNQTLDFAVEYMQDNKSIKLQSYTYAWNIDEERLTSFSLAFTYGIPFKELF